MHTDYCLLHCTNALLSLFAAVTITNSPAQAMPLVECVRGAESSPNTIATVLAATRKLGKVSNSYGTTLITATLQLQL
jgi:3-hydroxyacyl-CoA dehydrogenase, NAD binding domain